MQTVRVFRLIMALCFFLTLPPTSAATQEAASLHAPRVAPEATTLLAEPPRDEAARLQGSIAGTVSDARTGQAISSVQLVVEGTTVGGLSQANGRFLLVNVPVGTHTVTAQRIGYSTASSSVTVAEGETATLDLRLEEEALSLDEIVVTGTAGRQLRRTQAAQVDVVRAGEIAEIAPIANMQEMLQSRSTGVSLLQGGGSPGAGQRIRIRGPVSVDLSSQPLVFVDGVRINASNETTSRMEVGEGSGSGSNTGGAVTSRLNDIAPEDIESIEIVKGPAAATLYGADASSGVINIITKRGNQGGFQQSINMEYNAVEPTFTPPDNWGRCTAEAISSGSQICSGKSAGDLISDNPLQRTNTVGTGHLRRLSWTGQGGSADYQYFASLTNANETGMLPSEEDDRWTGRVNFSWQPHDDVSIRAGYGVVMGSNRQIDNGNSLYGLFVNAFLGDPLTLGAANDGWLSPRRPEDIAAIENTVDVVRNIPTLEISYEPFAWLSNRLIVGGDFSSSETLKYIPKNDEGLYRNEHNAGFAKQTRRNVTHLTLDYLANMEHSVGSDDQWALSLALGTQMVSQETDLLFGDGVGFPSNSANALSAAAERSGGQWYTKEQTVGYLSQLGVGHRDRIFLQVGLRADQSSSFGDDVPIVWLPKVGLSFVASETDFVRDALPFLSTLRLRGAYGTTGRAPRAGTSLRTFGPAPFVGIDQGLGIGITLANPGNPELKPERGTEIELGADLSMFQERIGLEVTVFNQTTVDAILPRRLPPSAGYTEDPFVNIGKVRNRGVEARLDLGLIRQQGLDWSVSLGMSTLENELLDLGDLPSFGGTQRFLEGYPLGALFAYKVRDIDVAGDRVVLSDTLEYMGPPYPTFESSLTSTLQLGSNLSLFAHIDGKWGYIIENSMASYRDTSTPRNLGVQAPETLPDEERLQRFGPFVTESGESVNQNTGNEQFYMEDGDHIKLREVALTWAMPQGWANLLGANRASITLSGRNLVTWTDYQGLDPEVQRLSSESLEMWDSAEFFMIPPGRRLAVRLNLRF